MQVCLYIRELSSWTLSDMEVNRSLYDYMKTFQHNISVWIWTQGPWQLVKHQKQTKTKSHTDQSFPQTTKVQISRNVGVGVAGPENYCIITKDVWKGNCRDGHCSFINNARGVGLCKRGRGAELCKQTEIVCIPIRLNRKPSQLTVYSKLGSRGQKLLGELFLDCQQTDEAVSGDRWQLRDMESVSFSWCMFPA